MKEIKVRSKQNKQFILKEDGTYVKVNNFKVGDNFKFIKEWKTSEGNVQVDDSFIIDSIWKNDKKSQGVYWINGECDDNLQNHINILVSLKV